VAKTYNTIGTFTAGNVLTAAEMNDIGENSNNYRVPPMCRVVSTGDTAIAHNTFVAESFDGTEAFDTDSMHDPSSNPSRITINTAGVYLITGNVLWQLNTNGSRQLWIRLNGSTYIAGNDARCDASYDMPQVVTTLYEFAANDYVELVLRQDSNVSLNSKTAASYAATFQALWVGQVS
jgi:hypothetical protein